MAKGRIVIIADKCKGCGICISVCPKNVLGMDTVLVNRKGYHPVSAICEEECIACANCAVMCPDGIINIYKKQEV